MATTHGDAENATAVFVLGPHRSGISVCAEVLRSLGAEIGSLATDGSRGPLEAIERLNDDVLRSAGGSARGIDPMAVETGARELPRPWYERAKETLRAFAPAETFVVRDPRCSLTLPFWTATVRDPLYVVCYRHPLEAAMSLRTRNGWPLSVGLALWELYMLSVLHHSRDRPRHLVRYEDLVANPRFVASNLHDFLRGHDARGIHLGELSRITDLVSADRHHERADPETRDLRLTVAQRILVEALERGEWPDVSRDRPFAHFDSEPLRLFDEIEATRRAEASGDARSSPGTVIDELGRELGRVRAETFLVSTRAERLVSERSALDEKRAEAEVTRRALDEALRREGELLAKAAIDQEEIASTKRELARLEARTASVGADARIVQRANDQRERVELSRKVLRSFRKQLYRRFSDMEIHVPVPLTRDVMPKVMIGTLSSGENEHHQCLESVAQQRYPKLEHKVFTGLGKADAVATLMDTFRASDCDLLVKVDADMVLTSPDFVSRVVDVFHANREIDIMQMAILDFFSGGPIQGINAYRRRLDWVTEKQDRLFTDRVSVSSDRRLVVWSTFLRDAVHSPNPSPFQAFHFGVHRGMKVLQPGVNKHSASRAEEQLAYLEKTWAHFQVRRDRRLALAALGFELAVHGRYELGHLDYTNPALHEAFAEWRDLDTEEIARQVVSLRETPTTVRVIEEVRMSRAHVLQANTRRVNTILVLLPHVGVFGGVNRFFELARQWRRLGVRCVIAQPDPDPTRADADRRPTGRPDEQDVEVGFFSDVMLERWDVVLTGDALGGMMLTLPLFEARMVAVYLLNGLIHERFNRVQIEHIEPDVVIACSSYAAAPLRALAPTIVPGGIDLSTFYPPAAPRTRHDDRLRLCVYPGRRKPVKRFEDALDACRLLHARGIPIELHAYDENELVLEEPFPFVFHGGVSKVALRELLWNVDIMLCPEEHAGWSNPAAEAMACGTALITTGAGATDIAIHEKTALLVEPRAPRQIADAVERLYREPALRAELVRAGLEHIQSFDWSKVARSLLDVFSAARLDHVTRDARNQRALKRVNALCEGES